MVLDKGGYYPLTFSMYILDELSEELNKCNVGCNLNGLLINHIMYADDLVLISPSSAGLSQLMDPQPGAALLLWPMSTAQVTSFR